MAEAKADQIIDKIVSLLSAITATSTWVMVERDRQSDAFDGTELPGVSVELGPSVPLGEFGPNALGFLDSHLSVTIALYVTTTGDAIPTKIQMAMYKELYVELLKNIKLQGLSKNVIPRGWGDPVIGNKQEQISVLETHWDIQYRHNYLDPSQ